MIGPVLVPGPPGAEAVGAMAGALEPPGPALGAALADVAALALVAVVARADAVAAGGVLDDAGSLPSSLRAAVLLQAPSARAPPAPSTPREVTRAATRPVVHPRAWARGIEMRRV